MNIDKKQLNTAKNYAEAYFEIAKAQGACDKFYQDLKSVLEVLEQSLDLKTFLNNPVISQNDKKDVIYKVFGKDLNLQTINLLNILADNKRFDLLDTVFYCYENMFENEKNIMRVNIVSAIELNKETKQRLTEKLEKKLNKKLLVDYSIEKSIIGGLIIKINDTIVDLSLSTKIKDMEKQLVKG